MGRGVETFSISRAMAFASYTPTQMGSTVLPPPSRRMTIGMLVTGSIINPRIFISISEGACLAPDRPDSRSVCFSSISPSRRSRKTQTSRPRSHYTTVTLYAIGHGVAGKGIGPGARDTDIEIAAQKPVACAVREVERAIIGRAADPLAHGRVAALHQDLPGAAHQLGVAANLDGALLLLN